MAAGTAGISQAPAAGASAGDAGSSATEREEDSVGAAVADGSESDDAAVVRRRGKRAVRGGLDRAGAWGSVSGDSAVEADRVGSSVMGDFS